MNEDGSEGDACGWWPRSADSNLDDYVGYVNSGGYVSNRHAYNAFACLPVCVIQ